MSANPEHDEDVARTDDLTRIAGIGPKRADRLSAAGIRTYAELAARSAEDLATLLPELTGLSAAQLDGWRNRARELAGPAVDAPAAAPAVAKPGNGQHEESFLVRVLLNEDNSVRRTTVRHVGTGAQHRWPGLEGGEISGFITTTVRASQSSDEPSGGTSSEAPTPGPVPKDGEPPVASGKDLAASAYLTAPAQLAATAHLAAGQTVLRAGEPFTMTMAVDLGEAAAGASRLAYTATIVAKPLAGGPKLTVAHSDGLIPAATPSILIDAAGLSCGTYRLDGVVSLRASGDDHWAGLAVLAEGLLVHVVPG